MSGSPGLRMPMPAACETLIRLRWIMLGLFAAGVAATYLVSIRIPSTFLPVEDLGYFFPVIQFPDGASLQRTDEVAHESSEHPPKPPPASIWSAPSPASIS